MIEQYFTDESREYTKKVTELAARVPDELRSSFVIYLDGATAGINMQSLDIEEKEDAKNSIN